MNQAFQPDLDAYLERIRYTDPVAPDLRTLNGIVSAHVAEIPFENLDILLGRPISVAHHDVERKLVHERRGGYCFEQNTLLHGILQHIGFDVTPISGRVMYQKPLDPLPSRTHLFLLVTLDGGDWLVDVGVGGLSPTSALRLVLDHVQSTPLERRRIVSEGAWRGLDLRAPDAVLYHQALIGDVWENVAQFTLEKMHPIDVELANWYTSTHPGSHFKDRLTVARSYPGGRKTLLNREFKLRSPGGEVTSRTLGSDREILHVLATEFGLDFPAHSRFDCPGLVQSV